MTAFINPRSQVALVGSEQETGAVAGEVGHAPATEIFPTLTDDAVGEVFGKAGIEIIGEFHPVGNAVAVWITGA